MILLSIIIPVYNNVNYIGKAIDNYLFLASDKTELVIMDGGSTDGTVEIIQSYAKNHPEIRWNSEKDDGQSDAMNKGIHISRGQFISFLNVDDYYSSGTFSQVIKILENDNSINFLVGDCNVWDENGDLIYINKPSKLDKWHLLSGYHFPVNPTSYFYRKSLHNDIGLYNELNHYNMDLEFLIQVRMNYKFHYSPQIWGNFRMLPNTKTVSEMNSNQLEKRKQDLLKHYFVKSSFYIRARIEFYKFYKSFYPKLNYELRRIKDKFKYEIKKINHRR